MPRLIVELRKRYPRLSVKPVSADRVQPSTILEFEDVLRNGLADVGFTNDSPDQRQDLIYWQLMPDPFLVVLRDGSEAANSVSVKSLAETPIVMAGPGPGCPVRILGFLQEHLGKEEPDYWTNEFDGLFRMVAEGVGVGIAPGLACRALPEGVTTAPFTETFERQILLAVSPGNLKIPAVRAFMGVLKEFFPESELPDLSVPIPTTVGGS